MGTSPTHRGRIDLGKQLAGDRELPVDTAVGLLRLTGRGLPFCGEFGTTRKLGGVGDAQERGNLGESRA